MISNFDRLYDYFYEISNFYGKATGVYCTTGLRTAVTIMDPVDLVKNCCYTCFIDIVFFLLFDDSCLFARDVVALFY